MGRLGRWGAWSRERGPVWTALRVAHSGLARGMKGVESKLLDVERAKGITGPGTVSSRGNTYEQNKHLWSTWDWSQQGEEWTEDARKFSGQDPDAWKARLIEGLLLPSVPEGCTVLEIGPGAGRWTEHLVGRAGKVVLADISQVCLDLCRERFTDSTDGTAVEYVLVAPDMALGVPAASIDRIWSYDVFVHVNPTDTDRYLAEFARVLVPGGQAVIHHSGRFVRTDKGFRAHMDAALFGRLAERHGLRVVTQDEQWVHKPNDVVSILERPVS